MNDEDRCFFKGGVERKVVQLTKYRPIVGQGINLTGKVEVDANGGLQFPSFYIPNGDVLYIDPRGSTRGHYQLSENCPSFIFPSNKLL